MYEDLTYTINGCLFTVYNTLDNIWPEDVYEKPIQTEAQAQGLQAERQKEFEVFYFDQRVSYYRLDLLIDDKVIVEVKAVPDILPIHQAQLISYLKGTRKQVGILANFGSSSMQHQTLPNRLEQKYPGQDQFDYDQIKLKEKEKIKALLFMANRVLVTLGAGYLPQIYRRALYYELKTVDLNFGLIKKVTATYHDKVLGSREVNFFRLDDLLLSAVTVKKLDDLLLLKFRQYLKHLGCRRGLIINFNATVLDFRYFEI
jgi:GxxExxY protein